MDTTALETELSKAARWLQNRDENAVPTNRLIGSLQACEQTLADSRFVRRRDETSGRTITIRIAGIESALIHVSQAIVSLEKLARGRGTRRGRPPAWMSDAETPKRRGRPPGSKNKPVTAVAAGSAVG